MQRRPLGTRQRVHQLQTRPQIDFIVVGDQVRCPVFHRRGRRTVIVDERRAKTGARSVAVVEPQKRGDARVEDVLLTQLSQYVRPDGWSRPFLTVIEEGDGRTTRCARPVEGVVGQRGPVVDQRSDYAGR